MRWCSELGARARRTLRGRATRRIDSPSSVTNGNGAPLPQLRTETLRVPAPACVQPAGTIPRPRRQERSQRRERALLSASLEILITREGRRQPEPRRFARSRAPGRGLGGTASLPGLGLSRASLTRPAPGHLHLCVCNRPVSLTGSRNDGCVAVLALCAMSVFWKVLFSLLQI